MVKSVYSCKIKTGTEIGKLRKYYRFQNKLLYYKLFQSTDLFCIYQNAINIYFLNLKKICCLSIQILLFNELNFSNIL